MTVRVISKEPVVTKKHICAHCGYQLEYNDVDLVRPRADQDEPWGWYLVCPRKECGHRTQMK